MTHDVLAKKVNPERVKELLELTSDQHCNKKVRIHDDPGELIRYKNKQARLRTNELYNEEYFKKFH